MRDLFRDTVLNVNARDYTEEEVKDWTSCWEKTERGKNFCSTINMLEHLINRMF